MSRPWVEDTQIITKCLSRVKRAGKELGEAVVFREKGKMNQLAERAEV